MRKILRSLRHLKNFADKLAAIQQQFAPGTPIEIWFQSLCLALTPGTRPALERKTSSPTAGRGLEAGRLRRMISAPK